MTTRSMKIVQQKIEDYDDDSLSIHDLPAEVWEKALGGAERAPDQLDVTPPLSTRPKKNGKLGEDVIWEHLSRS
jgi:hypothetical protein